MRVLPVSRPRRRVMVGLLVAGTLLGAAAFPVTTRQGINYQITTHRLLLVNKAFGFVHRDGEYRRLAAQTTRGLSNDQARAEALLNWTKAHISRTPKGRPILDDHILNIILRGYGAEDQMADVFATLLTYAGVPAFWRVVSLRNREASLILTFVQMDGRWTIWDVARGKALKNEDGALADVAELSRNPGLATLTMGSMTLRGHPYPQYLEEGLMPFEVPEILRAEKQMPQKRLLFELKKVGRKLLA